MAMLTTGPLYVSWNYTYACNFNCSHCYSRAASYPQELSTEQYEAIVDQFVDARVFKVGLGGGEPLIRKDCLRILERMGDAGIDTNITANGWFIDERTAARLAKARLGTLYVSLDSPDADEHDLFRRRTGSHARVLRALGCAVEAGVRVRLSTVVTSVNIRKLDRIVSMAEDAGLVGVEFKRFRPSGNGMLNREKYQLQQAAEEDLRQDVAGLQARSSVEVMLIYGAEPDGGVDSGCPCGKKSICVRPNGDVSPCAYGEAVIGNLMETPLSYLWQHSPELDLMRSGGGCSALRPNPTPSNPYISSLRRDAPTPAVTA
jgi:AdoMet-dependent heme synthase